MIYECPNCHVPQAAGHTACYQCGAEFDSPVPEDAIIPREAAMPPENSELAEPVGAETASPVTEIADAPILATASPPPPVLEEVFAPPPQFQPSEMPPYQASPAYQAAPAYQQSSGYLPPAYTPTQAPASRFSLPKALLIAIPIVLVLVLGAVFFANSLNQSADTAASTPAVTIAEPAVPIPASPVPHGSPLILSGGAGGSTSTTDSNPNIAWLVGRWQNQSTDYYVFNENGSGNRGSSVGKQAKSSFLWVLNQKQLVLYADPAPPEKLAFSQGNDDATMFLRGTDGQYIQYARAKTSP